MPKQREVDVVVGGNPAEVAERLRRRTRWRLIPGQGQFLGSFEQPLAGRVGADRFRVATNRRDWLTLTQAVAVGTLAPAAGGTRVRAVVGLPSGLTWLLRGTTVLSIAAVAGGLFAAVTGGAGATELAAALGVFGVAVGAATAGVGLNVHNADAQVEPLADALVAACSGSVEPASVLANAAAVESRRRSVDRATTRE